MAGKMRFDDWIVDHSLLVVAVFVLVTVFFMTQPVAFESGVDRFTEDTEEQRTLEEVQRDFSGSFEGSLQQAVLLQTDSNVLSRDSIVGMLELQRSLEGRPELQVVGSRSAAEVVARYLDPTAVTYGEKIRVVRESTPAEIRSAVRAAGSETDLDRLLGRDFNPASGTAGAAITSLEHESDVTHSDLGEVHTEIQSVVKEEAPDVRVLGEGLVEREIQDVVRDSLELVLPVAVLLIVVFLGLSFRDPFDVALGVACLSMTMVWTFGFTGFVGIPFSQVLVAVPPLLLGIGIDFSIHTVNRYREERASGGSRDASMRHTLRHLLVAFSLVLVTTVVGFGSNVLSPLSPLRDFGVVAATGIVFTYLICGVFLPAAKIQVDRLRSRAGFPEFGVDPLGAEGSLAGDVLTGVHRVSTRSPGKIVLVAALITVVLGGYALGVDTEFSRQDFLPPEDQPGIVEGLPGELGPRDYRVSGTLDVLRGEFGYGVNDVTVYVSGSMVRDHALESIGRAGRNPPDSFVESGGEAVSESVLDVIRRYSRVSPEFRRLVARNDVDGNGVPDTDLQEVYDALLSSRFRDDASQYVTPDGLNGRVVYRVEADSDREEVVGDARELAGRYQLDATPTGQVMVFDAVSSRILRSALTGLLTAVILITVLLVALYGFMEGWPLLGLVTVVPVLVIIPLLVGSMRFLGLSFNALTATVLAVTIGVGVDYSVHFTQRFVDEMRPGVDPLDSLATSLRGTGGALTGSMMTDVAGVGTLLLAFTPVLKQYGLLMALSVVYSYLAAVFLLPALLVLWVRFRHGRPTRLRRPEPSETP